jgi:hypothetical protein
MKEFAEHIGGLPVKLGRSSYIQNICSSKGIPIIL